MLAIKELVSPARRLTATGVLARSTALNLVGSIVTLLAGAIAIPLLLKSLSLARYGVLTLAWVMIGNFGLLDLGLGRALTKLVSEKLACKRRQDVAGLVWYSLTLMAVIGAASAVILGLSSDYLARHILKIPVDLQSESILAFQMLGLAIPVVVTSAGLRGVLEAQQRFDLANAVRAPLGALMFLGPLIIVQFTPSLAVVVFGLLAIRLMAWALLVFLVLRTVPEMRRPFTVDRAAALSLVRFGCWMAVTNIVSPLMTYMDRFLIGSILSMSAVAFYSTPYDLVTTAVGFFPSAVVAVLLPAFSATCACDPVRGQRLFSTATKVIFVVVGPMTLTIVTLAKPGLRWWLGPSFSANSTHVLQYLAIGAMFNTLAQLPFVLLQGAGRPRLTATIHMAELPVYVVTVCLLVRWLGIDGAAIAWLARVTVDAILMFASAKSVCGYRGAQLSRVVAWVPICGICFIPAFAPLGLITKFTFLVASLPVFYMAAWRVLLNADERHYIAAQLERVLCRYDGSPACLRP